MKHSKPDAPPDLDSLRDAVAACAARFGVASSRVLEDQLVGHATDVLNAPPSLHLTAIHDVETFVARHVGEALQGAVLIDAEARGTLLDLGSGNGYPGLVLCAARPGLVPLLAEASERRAAFLSALVQRRFPDAGVLRRQVQRPEDLELSRPLRVLVTRAMGGWDKIVPRLVPCLSSDGEVLLWAGRDAESVIARNSWRRLELTERTALADRECSWIWRLRLRDQGS